MIPWDLNTPERFDELISDVEAHAYTVVGYLAGERNNLVILKVQQNP
jgi:hypothetical protein